MINLDLTTGNLKLCNGLMSATVNLLSVKFPYSVLHQSHPQATLTFRITRSHHMKEAANIRMVFEVPQR